jgi:acylphosphatase
MRATRHIRVTGMVQGVFFRAWTRDEARRLGVKGWVRNCADGSVEAHLDGSEQAVEQLIERMRHGPPGARVNDLKAAYAEPEDFSSFEVRH